MSLLIMPLTIHVAKWIDLLLEFTELNSESHIYSCIQQSLINIIIRTIVHNILRTQKPSQGYCY